tara:strand:+ start:32 stop:247 length:216 start_codon:yes stop_codon:yes gene_type:complete
MGAEVAVILVGFAIVFISFVIAALNMGGSMGNRMENFDGMFKRHIWSMIGMAGGGGILLFGLIMLVIALVG